jgi:hypothetical protein
MSQDEDLLSNAVLLHRLDAGLAISGGARGSLTRCAVQLLTGGDAAAAARTDLQLQQIEMTKLLLMVQRNDAEIRLLEAEADAEKVNPTGSSIGDKVQVEGTVQDLRDELAMLKQVQVCLEEYEALAKLIVGRHTISEHKLQQELHEIRAAHESAREALRVAKATCRIRSSQFHLLQHCLQDLKSSLQNRLELDATEMEVEVEEGENDEGDRGVDEAEKEEGEEGEEEEKVDTDGDVPMKKGRRMGTIFIAACKIVQYYLPRTTPEQLESSRSESLLGVDAYISYCHAPR